MRATYLKVLCIFEKFQGQNIENKKIFFYNKIVQESITLEHIQILNKKCFWCFLDFLKSVLFESFWGLVFIAGTKMCVFLLYSSSAYVFDLINA